MWCFQIQGRSALISAVFLNLSGFLSIFSDLPPKKIKKSVIVSLSISLFYVFSPDADLGRAAPAIITPDRTRYSLGLDFIKTYEDRGWECKYSAQRKHGFIYKKLQ